MAQARPSDVSDNAKEKKQSAQRKTLPSAAQVRTAIIKLKAPLGLGIEAVVAKLKGVTDVFKARGGKTSGVCLHVTFASLQDAEVAIETLSRSAPHCSCYLQRQSPDGAAKASSGDTTIKQRRAWNAAPKSSLGHDEDEEEGQPRTTTHSPDPSTQTPTTATESTTKSTLAPAKVLFPVSQPQGTHQEVQFSSPKSSPGNFELVPYLPPIVGGEGEDLLKVEEYVLPGGDENDDIFVCIAGKQALQARTAPGPFDLRPFWENIALNVRVQGLQIRANQKRKRIALGLLLAMLKYQSNGIQPLAIQVVPTQQEGGVQLGADEVLTVRLCMQEPDEATLLTLTLHEKRLFSSQYELRHDPVTSSSSSSSSSSTGLLWKKKDWSPSPFEPVQIIQGRAEDLRQYAKFENDKCHFFAKHCGSGWPVQEVTHCSIVQVTPWGPTAVTQGSSFEPTAGWAMGVLDEDWQ